MTKSTQQVLTAAQSSRFAMHNRLIAIGIVPVLLLMGSVGCGKKSAVARVQGKVTLDGKPLAEGGIVTLPKAGRGSQGKIINGEFTLGTFNSNDGALIGTHQVAVTAQEKSADTSPEAKAGRLLIPQRYTNPDTSGLTIEVEAGKTNTPTLELKSK